MRHVYGTIRAGTRGPPAWQRGCWHCQWRETEGMDNPFVGGGIYENNIEKTKKLLFGSKNLNAIILVVELCLMKPEIE